VTDFATAPPPPAHPKPNVDAAVNAAVCSLPDVGFGPFQATVAEQVVALVLDQVSIADPPMETVVGDAEKVSVGEGGGGALTVTTTDC
jgi:hypothetical protein